jgi:hypothetical protein
LSVRWYCNLRFKEQLSIVAGFRREEVDWMEAPCRKLVREKMLK